MSAIIMTDKVDIVLNQNYYDILINITQTDYACKEGKVKCPGGLQCIEEDYMYCNGVEDCSDGSDESGAFCKGLLLKVTVNSISC